MTNNRDTKLLQGILGSVSILFAIGWWLADANGGAYAKMLEQSPAIVWGCGFMSYGLIKFYMASFQISKPMVHLVALFGLWMWLFTFISFADNRVRPLGSADVMILFMVVGEIWSAASTLTGSDE